MVEFDLPSGAINNAEFESMKDKLGQVARSISQPLPTADAIFYKVAFQEVPKLVAGRKVFINQGYAYVAMNQVVSLIVEALYSSYLGPDYSQPREYAEISLKDIDLVAKRSFPLCMRHFLEKLRENHHLKHGGRMQLGLFLKVPFVFPFEYENILGSYKGHWLHNS
ncbi:hypothetical protein L6164_010761 [Bauhinia variegata]|uniref:Uncharacterized protein n=1 Tax=Bauhinia variegata TaxID=167791 RepID=A0ACB9P474_BAUVA|nr:hypothetical protein L6164_010761 [Bauhinia variegata]